MQFFNRVKLLTPESVELEFDLAGIGGRALALFIDYNIIGLSIAVFWIIWGIALDRLFNRLEAQGTNYNTLSLWLLAIGLLITFIIFAGYFVFFEVRWRGQTPGKRLAKIRVIRDDGRPVGLSQATIRALLRSIDDILFIGVVLILLGRKEKRIGDWVAGTLVVQDDRSNQKDSLRVSSVAEAFAEQLPQQAFLSQLSPDNFAVIREYLQRRNAMTLEARRSVGLELSQQAQTLIKLEMPPDLTPEEFLEAVYLAYQRQFRSSPGRN